MQLLSSWGEEGDIGGLGIIPGIVKKFRLKKIKFHILDLIMFLFLKTPYYLMESIIIQIFIFVHSYHYILEKKIAKYFIKTFYETEFISGIQKENIFGVQFHPEKSQRNGLKLLENFNKFNVKKETDLHFTQ